MNGYDEYDEAPLDTPAYDEYAQAPARPPHAVADALDDTDIPF